MSFLSGLGSFFGSAAVKSTAKAIAKDAVHEAANTGLKDMAIGSVLNLVGTMLKCTAANDISVCIKALVAVHNAIAPTVRNVVSPEIRERADAVTETINKVAGTAEGLPVVGDALKQILGETPLDNGSAQDEQPKWTEPQ